MKNITITCILIVLFSCTKEPTPEAGFTENFYIEFDFLDNNYKIEHNDLEILNARTVDQDPIHLNTVSFESESSRYNVSCGFLFDFEEDKNYFEDLSNSDFEILNDFFKRKKNRVQFFFQDTENVQDYSSSLGFDYGASTFEITEVIKYKKQEFRDKKRQTYILRGNFEFNIHHNSGVVQPDTLYPVTNGRFSVKVIDLEFSDVQ